MALPELRLPAPIEVPLSRNVTVPVGVPEPGPALVTVAVNVTVRPAMEGSSDVAKAVEVEAGFTVCVKPAEVLPVKLLSPL